MTDEISVVLLALGVSAFAITLCWTYGLRHGHDLSLIDGYYGLGSLAHGVVTLAVWHVTSPRGVLLVVISGIWSIGLAQSLFRRWLVERLHGGDIRYRKTADRLHLEGNAFWWKSYLLIAAPQAVLITVLNLPLQLAIMESARRPNVLDVVALLMIAAGGAIEVIGNRQLEIFKRRRRPGQTLMTGVWAWSRHPNYFGNTLVYVGMFVAAMRDPSRWWTVVSPITILLVLRFVLGVRMTDQLMLEKRAGDPAYLDYVARTPAFVMKPPARRKAPLPATDESANLT